MNQLNISDERFKTISHDQAIAKGVTKGGTASNLPVIQEGSKSGGESREEKKEDSIEKELRQIDGDNRPSNSKSRISLGPS
jgi:hypothetical protein